MRCVQSNLQLKITRDYDSAPDRVVGRGNDNHGQGQRTGVQEWITLGKAG